MYTKCSKVIIYQRFHVYVRIASCGYIAVRKICDIYWEEHNMCCLVVQCSTKANHDDEVLPQFLEPLRFFVRFDGISVPVTTPAPMIPGREKTSWNIGKTRFKFALPLAVWCGMQFVPKNLSEFTNPNWPDNSPWIRLYCCGQWGWDSLLKRSQTVDVAFGGCLWSLATGDRILLKLEKISLIRQIYLEPYGSMMFNGTTHIFPSSQSIRLRLPEISPRCHSHGFEIRLLWIRFCHGGHDWCQIEKSKQRSCHSCTAAGSRWKACSLARFSLLVLRSYGLKTPKIKRNIRHILI